MNSAKIKILVVEDEVLLIKNIIKKLTAISPDIQIVGEAYNGKEALNIVKQFRPDVVFTDIRMPIMDGLELTKILHEEYPEILTVIVSGYDDFEYARTVLAYRVYDYILKPLQTAVLEKLFFSLKEYILKGRKEKISKLLQNQVEGKGMLSLEENTYTELEGATFFLALVCLGNLKSHYKAIDNTYFLDCSELIAVISPDFWVFPYATGKLYLLLADYSDLCCRDDFREDTSRKAIADSIHNALIQKFPECSVTIAYSVEQAEYQQLHLMADELHKLLGSSLVIGQSTLFERSAPKDVLPPAILPITTVNHLQVVITSNNTAAFQMAVKNLFLEWYERKYPQQWIEKVLRELLNILQRNLYFSEEESDKMFDYVFHILQSQNNLMDAADKIILELQEWIILYQSIPSEAENTIEELDAFIRSHYTEHINLAKLAEKYHFNPSYLTRIFKKEKGEAPLKLINALRIEDAKKLLFNPELSVKEISEMIGYSNQHYFSRIFKEFTKQTPKEYRNTSRFRLRGEHQ